MRYEQELSDDFRNCGAGPHDWVRDGRYLGQRLLHRWSALYGLRRHEGDYPRLRNDGLHSLRWHGHRAARERDGYCGEHGHLRHMGSGDRTPAASASTPAAWTQSSSTSVCSSESAASASWRGSSASSAERTPGCHSSRDSSDRTTRRTTCGSSSRRRWQARWRRSWRAQVRFDSLS